MSSLSKEGLKDQQSRSDTSIILEDENVQVESEPAFDGVNALAQIVDYSFKGWKVRRPCSARASAKLQAAHCQRCNDSTVRVL